MQMQWYVILSKLLGGLGVSLSIFLITLLFSLPLGLLLSFGRNPNTLMDVCRLISVPQKEENVKFQLPAPM